MKYVPPKYERAFIKTQDVLTASNNIFEIKQNENGTGNVIMNALDLFDWIIVKSYKADLYDFFLYIFYLL